MSTFFWLLFALMFTLNLYWRQTGRSRPSNKRPRIGLLLVDAVNDPTSPVKSAGEVPLWPVPPPPPPPCAQLRKKMKILSRWIPRLSASVHRFVSTARPLHTASGTPRWRPSAPARRVPPGFPAASLSARLVSSYAPPANGVEDETGAEEPDEVIEIFPDSSHRDGSIYSGTDHWKIDYCISDRDETWLDSMMFSDPTDCIMRNGTCMSHASRHMLQFLSLRLAKIPEELGSVELYGYIAARDNLNPLLNYIVNFSRDDPIIVKQGSLINMTGPKRGIELVGTILIEYDMRIKAGEHEKEDLQVIDGVSLLDNIDTWDRSPFVFRIDGDCGAIDVGVSRLNFAYQATVEVAVSQVQSSFGMRISCFTSGLDKEIRLFNGAIVEPRGLRRFVVAVSSDDEMELKLKVAGGSCIPAEYCCCFEAKQHGHATREISTGFALITVKVTWSTLEWPTRDEEAKAV